MEEAMHLVNAHLVKALLFHDLVEDGDVEGNGGNHGTGPGDKGLVH